MRAEGSPGILKTDFKTETTNKPPMEPVVKRADALKRVMRQVPFPVTIVTSAIEEERRGITIGSFTSLSMDPPLICFNVEITSQMHDLMGLSEHFVVNIPHKGNEKLCNHFSIPDLTGVEQLKSVSHSLNQFGIPVLNDVAATIECRKYDQMEAGDHTIFIGEVLNVSTKLGETALLYLNGEYYRLKSS